MFARNGSKFIKNFKSDVKVKCKTVFPTQILDNQIKYPKFTVTRFNKLLIPELDNKTHQPINATILDLLTKLQLKASSTQEHSDYLKLLNHQPTFLYTESYDMYDYQKLLQTFIHHMNCFLHKYEIQAYGADEMNTRNKVLLTRFWLSHSKTNGPSELFLLIERLNEDLNQETKKILSGQSWYPMTDFFQELRDNNVLTQIISYDDNTYHIRSNRIIRVPW